MNVSLSDGGTEGTEDRRRDGGQPGLNVRLYPAETFRQLSFVTESTRRSFGQRLVNPVLPLCDSWRLVNESLCISIGCL